MQGNPDTEPDPWDDHDPWDDRAAWPQNVWDGDGTDHAWDSYEPNVVPGESSAGPVAQVYAERATEQPTQRIIHDVPPVWDGKDPDSQAEPYLKLLDGWLATTRTLNTQQGMTILHYAAGDLKLIIN